ncbi:MAG: hypothetical protein CMM30_05235 [Rhodospirillaceae bacterium]|nr:hypothetical protein [Rhodospirillaceae bacterium]
MKNNFFKKPCLGSSACQILLTSDPTKKLNLSFNAIKAWKNGQLDKPSKYSVPPQFPAKGLRPELIEPSQMPKRKGNSKHSRAMLLHTIAHIEFTAINLAWDIIVRFNFTKWPKAFYDDWITVAEDETRHFKLISKRLKDLGIEYGDLPANKGLWNTAFDTYHDPIARLAKVPLALEARALDVTPGMTNRLRNAGDHKSANIIEIIAKDEIEHVKVGWYWFKWICEKKKLTPRKTFESVTGNYITIPSKPAFNFVARKKAGLPDFLCKQNTFSNLFKY